MTALRALFFNIYFFGLTFLMGIAAIPIRAARRDRIFAYARLWAGLVLAGARVLCGIRMEVTGTEHLPAQGAALLASQHQSAFDTLVWMRLLPDPSYVVKRELTAIPLFGPLLVPAGMIPVDRKGGAAALRALLAAADAARAAGRQIVIFPEGTRVAPGQRVKLQPGIAAIADRMRVPVVPVATDSGRCWGRRAFLKRPGIIRIAVGPAIPAETGRAELLTGIEAWWREAERRGLTCG